MTTCIDSINNVIQQVVSQMYQRSAEQEQPSPPQGDASENDGSNGGDVVDAEFEDA